MKHTTRRAAWGASVLLAGLALTGCDRNASQREGVQESAGTNATDTTTPTGIPSGTGSDATASSEAASAPGTASTTTETKTGGATAATGVARETKREKTPRANSGGTGKAADRKSAATTPMGDDGARTAPRTTVGAMTTEPGRQDHSDHAAALEPRPIGVSDSNTAISDPYRQPSATSDVGAIDDDSDTEMIDEERAMSGSTTSVVTAPASPSARATDPNASAALDAERLKDLYNPAKALEPQSKYPDHTGSTSITGVPRDHAQAGSRTTVFTDPTIAPLRDNPILGVDASVSNLNLTRYPYDQRAAFKGDMADRLESLDARIEMVRNDVSEEPVKKRREYRELVKNIEAKYKAAESRLQDTGKIQNPDWDVYKVEFRDQMADLERSYESLRTVMQ